LFVADAWNSFLIAIDAGVLNYVYAGDLDGDSLVDAMYSTFYILPEGMPSAIIWHSNLGNGEFGEAQILTNEVEYAGDIIAVDFDGDFAVDILNVASGILAWFHNLGNGTFGPQQVKCWTTMDNFIWNPLVNQVVGYNPAGVDFIIIIFIDILTKVWTLRMIFRKPHTRTSIFLVIYFLYSVFANLKKFR